MVRRPVLLGLAALVWLLTACSDDSPDGPDSAFELVSLQINSMDLLDTSSSDVPVDRPIVASFSEAIDTATFFTAFALEHPEEGNQGYQVNFFNGNKSVSVYPDTDLDFYTNYAISISESLNSDESSSRFTPIEATFKTEPGVLSLDSITIAGIDLMQAGALYDVPVEMTITARFTSDLDPATINSSTVSLKSRGAPIDVTYEVSGSILTIDPVEVLDYYADHELVLESAIGGTGAIDFAGYTRSFLTGLDSTFKFPEISDEELLTKVQETTFRYFWDYGHPVSGLARERNTSDETVTSGGSGFGVMAILVAIERGFITREEGIERLLTIVNFLYTQADRFHGAWSHWLNGTTGKARPFSPNDDGGDLVETAFMIQGLLTVRQYLNDQEPIEAELKSKINILWEAVEWDWYTQNGQDVLYWHWSPNFGWEKNHRISGWNEALIIYVLAASSPTHSIDASVYEKGWARNGNMTNGNTYYEIELPLGPSRGGPLFFSHYSFLGLDPRNLSDQYANYWEQNVNHSLINRSYCSINPRNYIGYGASCWGLTASDNHEGYSAHHPNNDKGVITPTAAISSIPYTPEESMAAMRHFYYILGDKLWGEYGFYDAFNPTKDWYASSYIAIDQGPIICMIENYRSGLLWDLFMSAPEIQAGLTKLGFTY